jgi:hypothetical protein
MLKKQDLIFSKTIKRQKKTLLGKFRKTYKKPTTTRILKKAKFIK